jgi:hypothetical protein
MLQGESRYNNGDAEGGAVNPGQLAFLDNVPATSAAQAFTTLLSSMMKPQR